MDDKEQTLLERTLLDYLLGDVKRCRAFGYNPTAYVQMLGEHGAVETVRRLLASDRPSDGFARLYLEGRLELAAEYPVAYVATFEPLFTDAERAKAKERLAANGFRASKNSGAAHT
ncbi:MAG: hypothetical protein ACKVVT_15015 [Dehalococcoidia bacterium]